MVELQVSQVAALQRFIFADERRSGGVCNWSEGEGWSRTDGQESGCVEGLPRSRHGRHGSWNYPKGLFFLCFVATKSVCCAQLPAFFSPWEVRGQRRNRHDRDKAVYTSSWKQQVSCVSCSWHLLTKSIPYLWNFSQHLSGWAWLGMLPELLNEGNNGVFFAQRRCV